MSVDFSSKLIYGHKFGEMGEIDNLILKLYGGEIDYLCDFFVKNDVDDFICFNGEDSKDWIVGIELCECDYGEGAKEVVNLTKRVNETITQLVPLYYELAEKLIKENKNISFNPNEDRVYLVQYCSY